jgi:hypothetical protein
MENFYVKKGQQRIFYEENPRNFCEEIVGNIFVKKSQQFYGEKENEK